MMKFTSLIAISSLLLCPALSFTSDIDPPWQSVRTAASGGVPFTVPGVENVPDLHGDPCTAGLAVFAGGNYFFAMADLVAAFEARHADLKGKIFYETLPPGIIEAQLEKGKLAIGNLTISVKPDVIQAGKDRIEELIKKNRLVGPPVLFHRNRLAIMVAKGNPKGIRSLSDLARPGLRLANPNPETEGIAGRIRRSLKKAGGNALDRDVYETKVKNGEARITQIHHRQTPLWIMLGRADAGVVWESEIRYQEMIGHPIEGVSIPEEVNSEGTEAAAIVNGAPHPEAARLWLAFLVSREAAGILEKYGIKPVSES